jgi:hypothetical protein
MTLTKGQTVRVRLAGTSDEWCLATVTVASENGMAVGLALESAVHTSSGGFIAGALPLLIDYEKELVTSLFGDEYEIEMPDDAPADARKK